MGTTLSILVLAFPSISMGNNLENLAKSLAKLRGEVETLQTQLDMEKEKHSSRMAALNSQLADLIVD